MALQLLSILRIALLGSLLSVPAALAQPDSKDTPDPSQDKEKILVVGDSLSAAYGIQIEEGWVYLLATKLKDSHLLINASISGETTDGGLRSLPGLLEKYHPEIVIIELGANDGLRGFPIPVIENNLRQLITSAKAIAKKVLLLGIHIPPNYGKPYTEAFHSLYQKLADEQEVALVPFFLDGVATQEQYMQADGLHPNASAQPFILETVWEGLKPLLVQP